MAANRKDMVVPLLYTLTPFSLYLDQIGSGCGMISSTHNLIEGKLQNAIVCVCVCVCVNHYCTLAIYDAAALRVTVVPY